MNFNLNENLEGDVIVFNNGNAGKVKNCKIRLEKKPEGDTSRNPDFKLYITDSTNSTISPGFYLPTDEGDPEALKNKQGLFLSRLKSIAVAVAPNVTFPTAIDFEGAVKFLYETIMQNQENSLVNVFVTYGTKMRPSRWLNTRFLRFIESASTPDNQSLLLQSSGDLMEKPTPDNSGEKQETTVGWSI